MCRHYIVEEAKVGLTVEDMANGDTEEIIGETVKGVASGDA